MQNNFETLMTLCFASLVCFPHVGEHYGMWDMVGNGVLTPVHLCIKCARLDENVGCTVIIWVIGY